MITKSIGATSFWCRWCQNLLEFGQEYSIFLNFLMTPPESKNNCKTNNTED